MNTNTDHRITRARTGVALAPIALLGLLMTTGCATQPKPQVDPLFQAVPGGRYECYYQEDNRNLAVKGATSTAGQAVLGGVAGGFIGTQFGSGSGRELATGAGAAAGAAAGAWNARRMDNNRIENCLQRQGYPQGSSQSGSPQGY